MAPSKKEIRIAVMGATGSGKSTFINLASSSTLAVGRGLESCTSDVDTAKPFLLDGRIVTLIDTPGFDDTTRSDTDILQCIVGYLAKTYEQGTKLAGIVYMHRISDVRMGGTSTRNFRIFRELCGDSTLRNVLVVTNFWGTVDPKIGEERENELASNDKFFKPVLKKGARLLRHNDTQASAHAILRQLIDKEEATLQIQKEIVDQHKDLDQTAAGAELARDLTEQAKRHEGELKKLREEMEDALRRKDEETRAEIQEEVNKVRQENERIKRESERMVSEFAAERARLDTKIEEMEAENRRRVQELQILQDEVVQVRKEVETAEQAHAQHETEILECQKEAKEEAARLVEEERRAREQAEAQHQERLRSLQEDVERAEEEKKRVAAEHAENIRFERERVIAAEAERRYLAEAREKEETARRREEEARERARLQDEIARAREETMQRERDDAANAARRPPPSGYRIALSNKLPFPPFTTPPCHNKHGRPVYIGSAIFKSSIHPCKITPHQLVPCRVVYGNSMTKHRGQYELLPFDPRTMEWVPTSYGQIPADHTPVLGGHEENGDNLYHAVATVEGVKIPGKTGEHLRGCYVVHNDQIHFAVRGYDILCWK